MEVLLIERKVDYGYTELKKTYKRYLTYALTISALIHGLGVFAYYAPELFAGEEEPTIMIRPKLKLKDLGPPPSITNTAMAPQVAAPSAAVKPSIGIPVPVPDAEVSPEQVFATQTEMNQETAPVIDQGAGQNVEIEKGDVDIKLDDNEPPPDFVPVEKNPEIVREVKPKYPELAMRAGLEGTVHVKIWVDKEGKPKRATVLKSDAEIFNEPSVDAAMQYAFTPAMMKNGPVAVWVTIPFKFRLTGK